jgi:FAD/FMN-containing dehydrogenase
LTSADGSPIVVAMTIEELSDDPVRWAALDAAIPGGLRRRGDVGWDETRQSFNGTIDRHPAAIVSCSSAADVVVAVRHARDAGLSIAVRGGGHSVAGHAIPDGALVISLDRMRSVEVDPVRRIARVGGGALWEDVDPATQAHGLAIPGGTFGDTGVGGLTLGGGLGWLLGVAGLTCDNLVSAEVVTADGEIVEAGPGGDPELLWALRGGGGNFGVVTRFDFALTPVTDMYGGHLRYPAEASAEVLTRLVEILDAGSPAFAPMVTIGTNADSGQTRFAIAFGYPGPAEEAEQVIAPLRRDLPLIEDDCASQSYIAIQEMSGRLPFGLRHYWKGHFLRELDTELVGILVAAVRAAPVPNAVLLIESIVGVARQEPPDGAAFGQRGARWNATVLTIWESPDDDARAIAWARETAEAMLPWSFNGGGYANYASADETDERVRAAFGSERFARLAAIKRRYDPENVFRFNLNIAPAG